MPRLLMATTVGVTFGFLMPFVRHFRRLGWKVDAATGTLHDLPDPEEPDEVFRVPWSRRPVDVSNLRAAEVVRGIVQRGRYDLVHVHTPVASFVTRFALRHRGPDRPRVIYTAHGLPFDPGAGGVGKVVLEALERRAARWTDHLVVINREDAEAVAAWKVLPPERIWWMPGIGVDLRRFGREAVSSAEERALRAELGIEGRPCLLAIAEFTPRKRHADLLQAFGRLAGMPSGRDAVLVLAGTGPLESPMRELVRSLGLVDRVRFLGSRRDVPGLLAVATALVLASHREGLPRCVLEAMAMGTPVIATRARGTAELLADGSGFSFEIGDVRELAALMERVLSDPAAAALAARRAGERVKGYREEVLLRLHASLYEQALSDEPAAPRPGTSGAPVRRSA